MYFTSLASFTGQELINVHKHLPMFVGMNSQTRLFPPLEGEEERYLRAFIAALLSESDMRALAQAYADEKTQQP